MAIYWQSHSELLSHWDIMFSSKEELNELENESLTATGSPFGEIITAPSRRIYMENHFISIHTTNLSSIVLIEHLWAEHL